jgi:hypothetical protein
VDLLRTDEAKVLARGQVVDRAEQRFPDFGWWEDGDEGSHRG